MSRGLTATFQFLAKTENETAGEILIAGLECPNKVTRYASLRALLERRDPRGHREVFDRLASMDERSREIIAERPARLVEAVVDALQDASPEACESACSAVASFRLYEALPALVKVLVDTENPHTEVVARAILKLAESFYSELSGTSEEPRRKQIDILRERITVGLEDAVRKYHRHERNEVVEAFLIIAKQKNVTLRQLLQKLNEPSRKAIITVLSTSSQGGVIRLLLGFLEDPQMPQAVIDAICHRCDAKFVDYMGKSVGAKTSKAVVESLRRFNTFVWAEPGHEVLDQLSELGQEGVVRLLIGSALDRSEALEVIGYLLTEGRPAGRRAAAAALREFEGPEASALLVKAINDEEPSVRAELITQIRSRRIPGALSMLIRMVGTREEDVQAALRKAMPEFTFQPFLLNFDLMDEELRPVTGHLVRQIDPEVEEKIVAEMEERSPVRRRRAVSAAGAMGLVQEVEDTIIGLLSDEDHMVRVATAKALADSKSMPAWEALRDALLDRSVVVKEAAEASLERISRSLLKNLEASEGNDAAEQEDGDYTALQPEEVAR